jgi:predicted transposase/invertase (TIGR01784 family)
MKSNTKTPNACPALIRFDWAMKRLLRQKANFSVLEGFLSVLLNDNIKIINIKESESNKASPEDKFNRVDIFVENNLGELMIIEMQNNEQADYFLRMLYGVSKAIVEHISEGEPYSKVRKVFHINIVYFKLGHGKDYVYRGINEFRGIHFNDVLQLTADEKVYFAKQNKENVNEVKDLFPEYFLLCVENFDSAAKDSLDEWMYYFKNNAIPDEFAAPGLEEARKRLRFDSLSEEEQVDYRHHLKQKVYEQSTIDTAIFKGEFRGEAKGLAKGLAKGKAERDRLKNKLKTAQAEKEAAQAEKEAAQKNVVLKMHQSGFTIDTISSITGLSKEDIISIVR